MEPAEIGAPISVIHIVSADKSLQKGVLPVGSFTQTLDQPLTIPNSILTLSGEFTTLPTNISISKKQNKFTMKAMVQILDSVLNNTAQFRTGDTKTLPSANSAGTKLWGSGIPADAVDSGNFNAVQFASYLTPLSTLAPFQSRGTQGSKITNPLFYYTVNSTYGLQGADCTFNSGVSEEQTINACSAAEQPVIGTAAYFLSLIQGAKGSKIWFMNSNLDAFGWNLPATIYTLNPHTNPEPNITTPLIKNEYLNWMGVVDYNSTYGTGTACPFYAVNDFGAGFTIGGTWGVVNFTGQSDLAPGKPYGPIVPCPKREEKWVYYAHYYCMPNMGNNVLSMSSYVRNTNLYNTATTPMDLNTFPINVNTGHLDLVGSTPIGFIPLFSNLNTPNQLFIEGALVQFATNTDNANYDICRPSDYWNSAMTRLHDKTSPVPSCYFMAQVNSGLDLPVDRMLSNYAAANWWGANYAMAASLGYDFDNTATGTAYNQGQMAALFCNGTGSAPPDQSTGLSQVGGQGGNMMCAYPGYMANFGSPTAGGNQCPFNLRAPAAPGLPAFLHVIPPGDYSTAVPGNNWFLARSDGYWPAMQMWSMPHTYFSNSKSISHPAYFGTEYQPGVVFDGSESIVTQGRNYPWYICKNSIGDSGNYAPTPTLGNFDPNLVNQFWIAGQWGTGPLIGRDYSLVNPSSTDPFNQGTAIPGYSTSGPCTQSGFLGGQDYMGVVGDAIGTPNMFVLAPHYGVYPGFRVPGLSSNPYAASNSSLIGGIYTTTMESQFTYIHVPNDVNFDFEGKNIAPVPLCYGQGFYNTYCSSMGSVGKAFKLPEDLPKPPEAPYDVINNGANWDLDWNHSYVNQLVFIANKRLMDQGTAEKPYFFAINNSSDSVMNSFLTNPSAPYIPRIGHTLIPFTKRYSALIESEYPAPCHSFYYNSPSPLIENNPRRDNYANYSIVSNQATVPACMMDLAHGAQATYGTCVWPKNHISTPGNISMFYNFPPYTDNLSIPDDPTNYSSVPSSASYQWLPYGPNSCLANYPNDSVPPLDGFKGLETQYRCSLQSNFGVNSTRTGFIATSTFTPMTDAQRYGYKCWGTASTPIATPDAYGNSPSYSHSFQQPMPEGHAQEGRQLPSYKMAFIYQRSTDPNKADQTFDEPLIFSHTFEVPEGDYSIEQLLVVLNEQLQTPDGDGNYPFLRYVDFTTGDYICTTCDDAEETDQPWLGADNISRYPNSKENNFLRGNRFGPPCLSTDEGRACKIFAGPPTRKLCGAENLEFIVNPQGYLVLTNTCTQTMLGGTTNPLPDGSSLVAGVNSIYTTTQCYQRVGTDPYQMGECGQTINGVLLTVDKNFYNNTTALSPIDYQLALWPCPYLPPGKNMVGCGTWPALTQYTAGLGPNGSFSNTPALTNTPTINQVSASEIDYYNYASQWLIPTGASNDNPYGSSSEPISVPGLPLLTNYSWSSNPAATFNAKINANYFLQATRSSLIGSVFNLWAKAFIPGETQIQLLTIGDTSNPDEVTFWSNLGVSKDQLSVFKPEFSYVELQEGWVYDQHSETYLFSKDAFPISNQSPYLYTSYSDIMIQTIPDTSIDPTNEVSVQKYLDALPQYKHRLASNDVTNIVQNTFTPFYAGQRSTVAGLFPPANFTCLGYNFTETLLQPASNTDFTCNCPMFLTEPSSFEGATLAGYFPLDETPPIGSANWNPNFLFNMSPNAGEVKNQKLFQLMAYKKGGSDPTITCSAMLPAVTRYLPMQMGEIAFANWLTQNPQINDFITAGAYLPMTAIFGNNPYNQHTSIAMPVSRTMNGGQFQISVSLGNATTKNGLMQYDATENPNYYYESLYYQRFHNYYPPIPNKNGWKTINDSVLTYGMDSAAANDQLYYPQPFRNLLVNPVIPQNPLTGAPGTNGILPASACDANTMEDFDWIANNYLPQLNVIAGNTWSTFANPEAWGFQCHETRDDVGLYSDNFTDQLFHGDLKSTTDPRDGQIFERGPKEPAAKTTNIWCGSHLGFAGINSVEYGIQYPSNYGMLTPIAPFQDEAVIVYVPLTHAAGNISFLLQHMAQNMSVMTNYSSTGEITGYEIYKQDCYDAQLLCRNLVMSGNQSQQMSIASINSWTNPSVFWYQTHSSCLALSWIGQNYNNPYGAFPKICNIIDFANNVWGNVSNGFPGIAQNCMADVALLTQTQYYQQSGLQNSLDCLGNLLKENMIQAPVGGQIHCGLVCPIRLNVSPNSFYQGLSSQPTIPEMISKNINGDYTKTINVFRNKRHCKVAKFCTNYSVFEVTTTFGPVFDRTASLPILQSLNTATLRGRQPLQTYNYLTGPSSENLIDASDPIQTSTWTNAFMLAAGLPTSVPIISDGLFLLKYEGLQFSLQASTNINGRSSNLLPMSIQSSITSGVFTFNSSVPFIVPAQKLDYYTYSFLGVTGKPITNIASSRLFCTFSPTNAPTPYQIAFLNSQSLESVHAAGGGQSTTAPSGGVLANVAVANPLPSSLTSSAKRLKQEFAPTPYPGYSTPSINEYSSAKPVFKSLPK